MKNNLVKNTLSLSIAMLISKILGSIFRIPLQNIAGDEVLGIFSLVYPVYMVALTLSVAGIPTAISKLISEANVKQNEMEIRKIYKTSVILAMLFGILVCLFIVSFSEQIAKLLGGESVQISLIVVSFTLLIAPYMAVFRGYFQGFDNMMPTAISQMLEQFIRVVLILTIALFLVKQEYSEKIIAGGLMISSFVGALVSLVYLRFLFSRMSLKKETQQTYTINDFIQMSKRILRISLPICIGAITMALINFVDSFTIPISLIRFGVSEEEVHYLFGIYSRGLSLVQIATVFSSSIVLPLIPTISKSMVNHGYIKVKALVERVYYYTHLISWPIAFGMFALTIPINLALFKDLEGSNILSVLNVSAVFTSLSILGTGILQGINKAGQAARIIIFVVLLKVACNILFINWFGFIGAAYSTLLVYIVSFFVNTFVIWRIAKFTILERKNLSIIISSIVMGMAVGLPTLFIDFMQWNRIEIFLFLLLAILIGGALYIILLLVTKGMNKEEISTLPFVKKIIRKWTK